MNSEWFFIRNKEKEDWIVLLTERTIEVVWDTDDVDQREILPRKVKLPAGIDLTNSEITNYLSNQFGYTVSDWWVYRDES